MKKISLFYFSLLLSCLFFGCGENKPSEKSEEKTEIAVSWGVIENNYNNNYEFLSSFTLKNTGNTPIDTNWTIYFNYVRKVKPFGDEPIGIVNHINGDYFKLSPSKNFKTLQPGESVDIPFISSDWAINNSDAPAGVYIVFTINGEEQKPIEITDYTIKPFENEKQFKRIKDDKVGLISAETLYEQNKQVKKIEAGELLPIVPSPVYFTKQDGEVNITASWSIHYENSLENEAQLLLKDLNESIKGELSLSTEQAASGSSIVLALLNNNPITNKKWEHTSAYALVVNTDGIKITGSDATAVFYGIQSLKALRKVNTFKNENESIAIQQIAVYDYPRFNFRGLHLDVARNFQKKEAILKLLDLMAFYKLNKFHFHLTEDEGWRLEIPGLPELTEIGAKRGHGHILPPAFGSGPWADENKSYGSGYYTRDDFIEILRYAKQRHIEVIPEIDVPGHARAAVMAMKARYDRYMKEGNEEKANEYRLDDPNDASEYMSVQMWKDNVMCICQESTFRFITKVIDEVADMYKEADAPFTTFHTGGDEVPKGVWEKSPLCEALLNENESLTTVNDLPLYFLRKLNSTLQERNLITGGWEEIAIRKNEKGEHVANPEFIKNNFRPNVWNNVWGWGDEDVAYKLANAGYETILSNVTHLYFDLAYNKDPLEPGYYWGGYVDTKKPFEFIPLNIYNSAREDRMGNPIDIATLKDKTRLTEKGKKNIIGIQGQLWSENVRGQELMEYMLVPKMISLAERAWSPDPQWAKENDAEKREEMLNEAWNTFANTLGQKELPRLDYLFGGVFYRLPMPGAKVENGKLYANNEFPGMIIRYNDQGVAPDLQSLKYEEPIEVNTPVMLRTFDRDRRGSRASVVK